MCKSILLFTLLMLSIALEVFGQEKPEWVLKIPDYYRLKGGSSTLVVDSYRNGFLFDGGPYDTYFTYDGGESWENVFDIKMFFVDVNTNWDIDDAGRWYYQGLVYNKYTVQLVSEDAGKTIRYLLDSLSPFSRINRADNQMIKPNAIVYDLGNFNEYGGLYSSCDAGLTFHRARFPDGAYGFDYRNIYVAPGFMGTRDREYNVYDIPMCDTVMNMLDFKSKDPYLRLADGTVITYGLPTYGDAIRIRKAGDTAFSTVRTYYDPSSDTTYPFRIFAASYLNDTTAIFLFNYGVAAIYTTNNGLQFINTPPRINEYQQIAAVGVFGDRVILQSIIPYGITEGSTTWILVNLKTGKRLFFSRPPSIPQAAVNWLNGSFLNRTKVVPVSDSTWIASLKQGELMRTTNAGLTWTMVDNIPRDEQWGLTYMGFNRLFPRGDGTVALLTGNNRLLVQPDPTSPWIVSMMTPSTHEIKTSVKNGYSSFTNTNLHYDEDHNMKYRLRYGASSIYFKSFDTLWTSGDAITRFTANGKFIDTVLHKKARFIKQLNKTFIVAGMDTLYFTYNNGDDWYFINKDWPKTAHGPNDTTYAALGDITLAHNGNMVVGLRGIRRIDTLGDWHDSIPGGMIYSMDQGYTWKTNSTGIPDNMYVTSLHTLKSGLILCVGMEVAIDPWLMNARTGVWEWTPNDAIEKKHMTVGSAFIYRSSDNGHSWKKVYAFPNRSEMPTSDPRIVEMADGRIMVVHPAYGIAISADNGRRWAIGDPFGIGVPQINDVLFTDDGWVHMATSEGYVKVRIENITTVQENTSVAGDMTANFSNGTLTVFTDIEPTKIEIYTIDGTLVHNVDSSGPIHSLALNSLASNSLASGTYLVRASNYGDFRTCLIQTY